MYHELRKRGTSLRKNVGWAKRSVATRAHLACTKKIGPRGHGSLRSPFPRRCGGSPTLRNGRMQALEHGLDVRFHLVRLQRDHAITALGEPRALVGARFRRGP